MKVHINPEHVTFVQEIPEMGKSKPQLKVGLVDGSDITITMASDTDVEREAKHIMTFVTKSPLVVAT
jgi:hypothetical protein